MSPFRLFLLFPLLLLVLLFSSVAFANNFPIPPMPGPGGQMEPCWAKKYFENMPLPPDTVIISVMGHNFRKKDECVPFNAIFTWTDFYNPSHHSFYHLTYMVTFPGELWYKKDTEEIAFAGNSEQWEGHSRVLAFTADGESCHHAEDDVCDDWTVYTGEHAILNPMVEAALSYHYPTNERVFEELFVANARVKFQKGTHYANFPHTVISNLALNPFTYEDIVSSIENNVPYKKSISYNNNNKLDDMHSHRIGTVHIELVFNPECPDDIPVLFPVAGQRMVFDSAHPGELKIDCLVDSSFPSRYWDKIEWQAPEKDGSVLLYNPASNGRSVQIEYFGMPKKNSDFGPTEIFVKMDPQDHCPVLMKTVEVKLFFERDGFNPWGTGITTVPNWYYYWQQTSAGHNTVDGVNISYEGLLGKCSIPLSLGVYHLETIIKPSGEMLYWGPDRIVVCDLHKKDYGDPDMSSTNFYYQSILNPSYTVEGIDTFGLIVLHELLHKDHYRQWWNPTGGWPVKGWYDTNGNGAQDPNEKFVDIDLDIMPDVLESSLGGYVVGDPKSFTELLPVYIHDEHHLTYKVSEETWVKGSADSEDWAKPGKQWPGN